MFWKYHSPNTRPSLRFLDLGSVGVTFSPSGLASDAALTISYLGFDESSKGCERNLLKEPNFAIEGWIWDVGIKESLKLLRGVALCWASNLLRGLGLRLGDALMKKWWLGLEEVTGDDDGITFEDSISFSFVAVLALRHRQLRQWEGELRNTMKREQKDRFEALRGFQFQLKGIELKSF